MKNLTFVQSAVAVAIGAVLTACGGGGSGEGGGGDAPASNVSVKTTTSEVVVMSGDPVSIYGTAITQRDLLKKMTWAVGSADGPALVLSNDACAVALKNDRPNLHGSEVSGVSEWSCTLGVATPPDLSRDAVYQLGLEGIDDKGAAESKIVTLRVKPKLTNGIDKNPAGLDFNVVEGARASVSCAGAPGSRYRWVVSGNDYGVPIALTNSNSQSPSFDVPAVTETTLIKLTCEITDISNVVRTSDVTVTILKKSSEFLPFVPAISPSAQILESSKVASISVSGGTGNLYYNWEVISGPSVPLGGASTPNVSFITPTVTEPTEMILRVHIGYVPITKEKPAAYSVDSVVTVSAVAKVPEVPVIPQPSISPAVSPTTQIVESGQVASITASGDLSNLYYKWEVVSGPALTLDNATSANVSFITPTVTQPTKVVLRAYMSKTPIDAKNSATHSVESSVMINPANTGLPPVVQPLTIEILPKVQIIESGKIALMAVFGGQGNLFYKWEIVSGPVVPLGIDNTASLEFLTPVVTQSTEMTLRASVSDSPITKDNPATHTSESIILVKPAS